MTPRSQWQHDVDDACAEATAAGSEYAEAKREMQDAQADAGRVVCNTQSKVDRAKARLEQLMESALAARSRSEDAHIPDGPARFADHFGTAREIWASEREFFVGLIEQLEIASGFLASAVEVADMGGLSLGIGGSVGGGFHSLRSGGGFGMVPFGREGFGSPPFGGAGALPGMFQVPLGVGFSTSPCEFGSPPLYAPLLGGTYGTTPAIGTPVIGGGWAAPSFGTPTWSDPLSLGTPTLTSPMGSLSPAVSDSTWSSSALPAFGTVGTPLGSPSMDLPNSSGWGTPTMASGGGTSIEIAPLVSDPWEGRSGDMGGVFKGAGHSHFTFAPDDSGWHVTTEVPGISGGYSERLDIGDFGGGFAMDGAGFGGFGGGCGLCS